MLDTATIPDSPWVVGLDLSLTSSGVAYADGTTGRIRPTGRGMARLAEVLTGVRAALDCWETDPELVVIEGYAYASGNRAHQIGELGGLVRHELYRQDIPTVDVAPSKLKIYATGRGDAGKAEMVANARERLGYVAFQPDEVDALWARAFGLHLLGSPLVALPKSHTRALDGVTVPARRLPAGADVEASWP
jgi:crossover junction endodeoxyribonuclease RuvC